VLHLIHPAWVHFAVAFLVAGSLAEAWGMLARREGAARFGATLVLLGTTCLVPTMVSGTLAANSVDMPGEAMAALNRHETFAWVLLAVYLAALFWKASYRGRLPAAQRLPFAIYLLLAAGVTAYTGLLGGRLVYTHGVGVDAGAASLLEHRLEGVAGDLRILPKPPHRVRVPVLAVRHVDAQPVAGVDQDLA